MRSDFHDNVLSGEFPNIEFANTLKYMNVASNFLTGIIPNVTTLISDYRYNYFSGCSDLCCLVIPCQSSCQINQTAHDRALPDGVEKSVWTELAVPFMGVNKRIIQIETHFSALPHLLWSFACPITPKTSECNLTRSVTPSQTVSDTIPLRMGIPYFNTQNANTQMAYSYMIQAADVCTTSVKV